MKIVIPQTLIKQIAQIVNPSGSENLTPSIRIFTLEGKHGSGKDLYAKILSRAVKHSCIIRFTDPIRQDLCRMIGVDDETLERLKRTNMLIPSTVDGKLAGLDIRGAMIAIATQNRSNIGDAYYANIALDKIDRAIKEFEYKTKRDCQHQGECDPQTLNIIIPDLRFEPEIEMLQRLVYFTKPGQIEWKQIHVTDDPTSHMGLTLPTLAVREI